MKRTIIALFFSICVFLPSYASEPKAYQFSDIHPKSLLSEVLESKVFVYGTIGLTAIVGVVVTYMSAGAGAPAVATGMSSVATWAGGGGTGSYMAGLSIIGGFFGGNAITGAAVLNGMAWAGGVTSVGKLATMPLVTKLILATSVTATALDGVMPFIDDTTGKVRFVANLQLPINLIGEDSVIKVRVNNLMETQGRYGEVYEEIEDYLDDNDLTNILKIENNLLEDKSISIDGCEQAEEFQCDDVANFYAEINDLNKTLEEQTTHILEVLEGQIKQKNLGTSDILFLSVIAYQQGEYELFQKSISSLKDASGGYVEYLKALSALLDYKLDAAKEHLHKAIIIDEKAIEPRLLFLNVLDDGSVLDSQKVSQIQSIIREADEPGGYVSLYNLTSLYFRAATIFEKYKYDALSSEYYGKTMEDVSDNAKDFVTLKYANSLYRQGMYLAANQEMKALLDSLDEPNAKKNLEDQYIGKVY